MTDELERLMQLVRDADEEGDYERALIHLEKAQKLAPDDEGIALDLVETHWQLGNEDSAKQINDQLLENNPDNPDALNNKALIIWRNGGGKEALPHLIKSLEVDKEQTEIWVQLALMHNELENYDEAKKCLVEVLNRDPAHEQGMITKAEVHSFSGEDEDAIKAYEKYFELYPTGVYGHRSYARHLAGKGDYNKSIDHLSKALAIAPEQGDVIIDEMSMVCNLRDKRYEQEEKQIENRQEEEEKTLRDFEKWALAPKRRDDFLRELRGMGKGWNKPKGFGRHRKEKETL